MTYDGRLKYLKCHSLEHRRLISSLCKFYTIYYKLVSCDIFNQFHASLLQHQGLLTNYLYNFLAEIFEKIILYLECCELGMNYHLILLFVLIFLLLLSAG